MPFAVFYNAKGSLLNGKNECHLLVSKTNYALSYSIFLRKYLSSVSLRGNAMIIRKL